MMLSARIRLLLSRTFTVIVTVLVIGGSIGSIAALPAGATITPKLIATWKTSTMGTLSSPGSHFTATGLVLCLSYGSDLTTDSALPFPGRITNAALVGCDQVLKPGATRVVEYNASNDAKFAEFVAKFTNATDDMMIDYVQMVDDSLMPAGPGSWGGGCESVFGRHKVKTCSAKNLLTGYTVDFIRLTASNIVSNVSTDGTYAEYSADMLWEAYGHR